MTQKNVFFADWLMPNFDIERQHFEPAGITWSLPDWKPPAPPAPEQHREILSRLASTPHIDAVIFQLAPMDAEIISSLPKSCKLIQRVGTGLDTIDLKAAAEHGIPVRNTPVYCVEEVSIHTQAMLLSLHRQLDITHDRLIAGQWGDRTPNPVVRLSNLTLGVLGFGRIGQNLAGLMRPLVGKVMFHDPVVTDAPDWAHSVSQKQLLQESDFIALHCPLMEKTRHIINAETLKLVKPTAILLNAARGALIDPKALAAALEEGRLAGAGLDVFEPEILPDDSPLRKCPNTILTSHVAWYSEQSMPDARREAVTNVMEILSE